MNDDADIQFCVQVTVKAALTLPLPQAQRYLGGFLKLVGDQEEVAAVREAYMSLRTVRDQLEAICGQQLLPLEGNGKGSEE